MGFSLSHRASSCIHQFPDKASTEVIRLFHVDAKPFCILSIQGCSLSHASRPLASRLGLVAPSTWRACAVLGARNTPGMRNAKRLSARNCSSNCCLWRRYAAASLLSCHAWAGASKTPSFMASGPVGIKLGGLNAGTGGTATSPLTRGVRYTFALVGEKSPGAGHPAGPKGRVCKRHGDRSGCKLRWGATAGNVWAWCKLYNVGEAICRGTKLMRRV
mmetsp:Transcript_12019/g.19785  ORF Transcript_12019/g.19785 Transcript_12019/m.19785 type:complete len:217 (+) Transcript_12019:85-735(+)